jgi:hypothetical protein
MKNLPWTNTLAFWANDTIVKNFFGLFISDEEKVLKSLTKCVNVIKLFCFIVTDGEAK